MAKKTRKREAELVGFLGVGLDAVDGHQRVTTGENFVMVGGSDATHGRMVETALQVNEKLRERGKRLQDATPDELLELFDRRP